MKRMLGVVFAALALCLILNIPEERTQAGETLKVPDTYSTIQAAIDAALNGDTVLVADGTYTGSGNKDLDFDGKAITVKSEKGPKNCIIDCQDDGRGFYFHNDETSSSVVEGFTIKNGDTGIYYGAGIYCYDGACPTIKNCVFEDNSTRRGGAIACKKNSSATISNCIMKNNWALYGGGIWLYDDSDATIKDCVITNNTADNNGGGIQSYDSNPTITNCLIANNEAISPGVGGGVYFYEGSVGTLTNCTIANNEGRYGGGVAAKDQGTTMTLNNTIIWGNHASTYGHQIRAYGYGAVVLNYCDYANGYNDVNTSSQGTVTPSNCINSDPVFVDSGSTGVEGDGDYHIKAGSPCIDAGDNSVVTWDYDLGGNWRIIHDTVEIGAYEYGIFKDRASDRGIQGPSGGAENVVWEDFDGDGYPDMYVTSSSGSNILYINDGAPDQTFTDATSANGVAGPTYSRGACAADYDNDGDVDLLVTNESGDVYLYRNNRVGAETGDFTEVASDAGLSGFSYSVMACWGDYDNDSYVDLYVVKSQGNCKLFQNDGDGTFTDVTSTAGVSGPSSGSSAVWCDIDSDNKLDLFVVGTGTGSAKLYQNNSDGTFADITQDAGVTVEGKSVAFGDIDNDGDFDFCVAVPGAANYLLKNNFIPNETLTFTEIASSAGVSQPTNAVDCYFGDFDNDGDIDINITADDGNSSLFRSNGDLTFSAVDTEGLPSVSFYAAAAAGQELCDGWPTLWVANSNGYSSFWEQRPNGNNWIVFLLQPTVSNKLGIGTRVELTYAIGETTKTITREMTAGTGWGSQGSVGLHMGLAEVSKEQIQEVKVTWPSGIIQYLAVEDLVLNCKCLLPEKTLDLDAMKVSHNSPDGELDDFGEDGLLGDGAFVPLNNDDDDYDASNQPDKDQTGAITGESDLLPILLHKISPITEGGKYDVKFDSDIKVWKKPNLTEEVQSITTKFDATTDTTLYVEGISEGYSSVELNWENDTGTEGILVGDKIKITVFKWLGPLNVPSYSIYRYTATGGLSTSKWVDSVDGEIKAATTLSDVAIFWDTEGAVVGKAIYEVNENYTWDLEVNIVKLTIKSGATNSLTYLNPPFQQGGAGSAMINSHDATGPAMEAKITVERIEGPTVAGNMRGVKFMQMGFIHNATFVARHADFNGFTPPRRYTNSLQDDAWHLDQITQPLRSTRPWYDDFDQSGADGFYSPSSDAAENDHDFNVSDRPRVLVTDQMSLTIGGTTDDVDYFGLYFSFLLYFAVSTSQDINGSKEVYTQRAGASWIFNGTGTVAAGTWTQTGSGNTGDASFTEVKNGAIVPFVFDPPINDLFEGTWTIGPRP